MKRTSTFHSTHYQEERKTLLSMKRNQLAKLAEIRIAKENMPRITSRSTYEHRAVAADLVRAKLSEQQTHENIRELRTWINEFNAKVEREGYDHLRID